ncbi:MAG TPA: prepilin-type N-terminal cleavage/methylation domain-containing protein [Rhizomicrobium sp.]|jgi:prepilin-type N-terminal cleavage/methylation domain-containing protein
MSEAGDRGFTLLEALVVLAITAMIAAIVAPNMMQSLALLSLRESARVVQADFRVARATAMRTGNIVTVTPRPDHHGYDWVGGTRQLPEEVRLDMSAPVSFMPDGSMKPADVALWVRNRRVPINFNTAIGAITAGS